MPVCTPLYIYSAIRFTLLAFLLLLPTYSHAADAPLLAHGINLSSWLANAPRQPLYPRDFALLKQAGFDNVRLPFNPELYGFTFSHATVDFRALDAAIAEANKQGLAVVLDLHPRKAFKETLETHADVEQAFIALWQAIATHYKQYPANQLAFELLNEPQYYHAASRYTALVAATIHAIRQEDSQRLLIIGAPYGSSIAGLQALQPVADAHIAYDFHFYEPYILTHQGSHDGFEGTMLRYFHGVAYPAARATQDAAALAPDAPNPPLAEQELAAYTDAGWNAGTIAARIRTAKAWADAHHARLLCGEFGVRRRATDSASRYRWIADTRTALEQNGIGWQLWDYSDLFGITHMEGETSTDPADGSVRFTHPEHGKRSIEPTALAALGLKHE